MRTKGGALAAFSEGSGGGRLSERGAVCAAWAQKVQRACTLDTKSLMSPTQSASAVDTSSLLSHSTRTAVEATVACARGAIEGRGRPCFGDALERRMRVARKTEGGKESPVGKSDQRSRPGKKEGGGGGVSCP